MLADAIEENFGDKGVRCEIKVFETTDDMKAHCPVIIIVHYKAMLDHFVTVLEVDSDTVLIGDPLNGKEHLSHKKFEDKWRQIGIVVQKN